MLFYEIFNKDIHCFLQDEEQDSLIRSFTDLKDVMNQIGDLRELDPNHFLGMLALFAFYCRIYYCDSLNFAFVLLGFIDCAYHLPKSNESK